MIEISTGKHSAVLTDQADTNQHRKLRTQISPTRFKTVASPQNGHKKGMLRAISREVINSGIL